MCPGEDDLCNFPSSSSPLTPSPLETPSAPTNHSALSIARSRRPITARYRSPDPESSYLAYVTPHITGREYVLHVVLETKMFRLLRSFVPLTRTDRRIKRTSVIIKNRRDNPPAFFWSFVLRVIVLKTIKTVRTI
ncbi:hypothetical protein PUN28_017080 [Cardiocondyla obscurior]|uniref:Uncharacterized protein n=1 Tax=Cardiocondyla obscurior TaxID=286306 RepID=A0AAW2EQK8_9HYME